MYVLSFKIPLRNVLYEIEFGTNVPQKWVQKYLPYLVFDEQVEIYAFS